MVDEREEQLDLALVLHGPHAAVQEPAKPGFPLCMAPAEPWLLRHMHKCCANAALVRTLEACAPIRGGAKTGARTA